MGKDLGLSLCSPVKTFISFCQMKSTGDGVIKQFIGELRNTYVREQEIILTLENR